MIDSIRPTVVQVECDSPNGSSGSGFFANTNGIVATALHVVTLSDRHSLCADVRVLTPLVAGPGNKTFMSTSAKILAYDALHDIALVLPAKNLLDKEEDKVRFGTMLGRPTFVFVKPRAAATIDLRPLRDGEPVFASGYPLSLAILITTSGNVAGEEIQKLNVGGTELLEVYDVDMHINHGNSGGPVFSSRDGSVIGMVDAFRSADVEQSPAPEGNAERLQYNSGLGVIIPAKYIEKLVRDNPVIRPTDYHKSIPAPQSPPQ
ncbi:MAG TPA: serine protease [Acidisarcina sp.]